MNWIIALFVILALALTTVGLGVVMFARRRRAATGIPWGDVVFADLEEERVDAPLISQKFGLVGKPDLLLRTTRRGDELLIPVEVKSGRQPASGMHEGHVLQLGAYLLLVEENFETAPTFGIVRYADGEQMVAWTAELRAAVLDAADEIRAARGASDVARSHDEPGRCANCGYRHACDEAL